MALALLTGVFLLVPGGTYLSDRWRWVARVAWAGMGLYVLGLVLVGRNGINRSGDAIDARPHVQVILSGGVILITADASGQRRRDAEAAPRSHRRGPPAAPGRHARGDRRRRSAPRADHRAGLQRRQAAVVVERAALRVVPGPRRLHRGGGVALPALRGRGDRQPGRGARDRHGLRGGRLRRSGRAAGSHRGGQDRRRVLVVVAGHGRRGAGVPAAATPGPPSSPTVWPTGTGPRRTTRSPTSAAGSGAAPRPTSCCRRSRRPPAKRCTRERAVVRLEGEGGAGLAAAWPEAEHSGAERQLA